MGKLTYKGLTPKDHPMFSGGAAGFSRLASRASSPSTPIATDGEDEIPDDLLHDDRLDEDATPDDPIIVPKP